MEESASSPPKPRRLPEDWVSVALMAGLALITLGNVLIRYFTDQSFAWTEEISVFLMIVVTMVGTSSAIVRQTHIRIEALAERGSASRQYRMAQISAWLVVAFFLVLMVLSCRLVWDEFIYGETSPAIGIPTWWYSIWLPVLSLVIALRAVGVIRRLRLKETP